MNFRMNFKIYSKFMLYIFYKRNNKIKICYCSNYNKYKINIPETHSVKGTWLLPFKLPKYWSYKTDEANSYWSYKTYEANSYWSYKTYETNSYCETCLNRTSLGQAQEIGIDRSPV